MTAVVASDSALARPAATRIAASLVDSVAGVLAGRREQIEVAAACVLAGGHLLIEDLPGVGKTLLAQSIAASVGGSFARVQGTSDLLPADVVGSLAPSPEGLGLHFRPGPVFANVVLFDELNRANPRTQSALLEVMEEGHVTVDGHTHPVPAPFVVVATQNPVESQGTYPLPEAQLDRFLVKLTVADPPADVERTIVRNHAQGFDPADLSSLSAVTTAEEVVEMQKHAQTIRVDEAIIGYIVELVRKTRDDRAIELGASPRASIALLKTAQVIAASEGRAFVTPDDVKPMVKPVLRHRVMLHPDAQLQGITADSRIDEFLRATPVPRVTG